MTNTDNDPNDSFSPGLWFYWYERKPGEEHRWHWEQLRGSMHRLRFISEEFTAIKRIRDTDLALQRLAYHMENYLNRVYELRERTVKLFVTFTGSKGKVHLLKGKRTRINAVGKLTNVDQTVIDTYLELLTLIDDDIDLRNRNTHDTFLSLGLATEHNIHDPHDALLDIQNQQPNVYDDFKRRIRKEIGKTVMRYNEKIATINRLTMKALVQMDFINRRKRNGSGF